MNMILKSTGTENNRQTSITKSLDQMIKRCILPVYKDQWLYLKGNREQAFTGPLMGVPPPPHVACSFQEMAISPAAIF